MVGPHDWMRVSTWRHPWFDADPRECLSWLNDMGIPLDEEGFRTEARLHGDCESLTMKWCERLNAGQGVARRIITSVHALWEALLPEEPAPELLIARLAAGTAAINEGKKDAGLSLSYQAVKALLEMAMVRRPREANSWVDDLVARCKLPELYPVITMLPKDLVKAGRIEEAETLYSIFARLAATEPGRSKPSYNAPCPCGSGKKYKRCCGKPK